MLGGNPIHLSKCTAFLKLTSMFPTSKVVFSAKYRLSNEKIPAIICKFLDRPVEAIVTVAMHSLGNYGLDSLSQPMLRWGWLSLQNTYQVLM